MQQKKCKGCGVAKDVSHFTKNGKYNNVQQYRALCKVCQEKDWAYRLVRRVCTRVSLDQRFRCERREDRVTKEFLEDMYDMQDGKCFWLGIPLDIESDSLSKVSVDRINNDMPYQKDNVVLASVFANVGRSNYTVLEFIELLDKIK